MDVDRHGRAKELFLQICDLPEEERPAALDKACGDDQELRREVESLLNFHGETEDLPATETIAALPDRIGEYRVLSKLGEGGMGIVYEVRQDHPIRRRLALKLVKWGMDTEEVLARFESERQALALMNHPNIAKVFEAGATDQGRPYFTMEYIEGEPLTAYCDRHRLSTNERLELFSQVCDGVQHAHLNGIIHRDIKSSNLLVRVRDDVPVPTIIDFGIAKATQQRLTERTLFTERGTLIGTPEYMSPEQAELTGLDVDTRTDVYSLGVVLYELLVGALPFDPHTLREAGFDEIRRKIREDEPSKPSTRLSTLGDASTETARRRRTSPADLRRELSGDMDWITMKALEKERTRRYGSPAEMAADIARHLRYEPVLASPPGTLYQLRKFVRRHRLGVAAGAMVASALIIGLTLATIGMVRARQAESVAIQEAARANKVSDLLIGLFDDLNSAVPGSVMTPEQILDRGMRRIEQELAGEPALQARLMGYVAGAYGSLGRTERAGELVERSVALCREHLPPDHPHLAASINLLGEVAVGSGDLERAQRLNEEALEIWKKVLGPNRTSVSLGRTYLSLGSIRLQRGDFRAARTHLDRAEEILEGYTGTYRIHLAYTLTWQAILDSEVDLNHRAALPRLEQARAILETEFGPDNVRVMDVLLRLGRVHYRLGDHDRAQELYEHVLNTEESNTGGESHQAAMAMTGMGELLAAGGDLEPARQYLERALVILEGAGGTWEPGHYVNTRALYQLACIAALEGEHERALELLRSALDCGYDREMILDDADLASLRDTPEFEKILAEVRRRLARKQPDAR